jgi:16S rRNA (guanine527-N7)-methyltransferase
MTYEELKRILRPEVEISGDVLRSLKEYASLLKSANETMNLTSITEEGEVVEKHFCDSLLPLKADDFKGSTLLDVGSGAGFPGMAIAIARPDMQVTLLDATAKKCAFMRKTVDTLGLKNVKVVNARAEAFDERESYDIVIARAVAPLNELLEILTPWAKVGGLVIAMKGSKGEAELKEAQRAVRTLSLRLIGKQGFLLPTAGERLNLFFRKEKATQKKYPRDWASIHSRPL